MRPDRRAVLAGLALAGLARPAIAAPGAELDPRWTAHGAGGPHVDHARWDGFLKAHVRPGPDGVNRIAYGAVPGGDRQALKAYLAALQALDVDALSRDEQLAYWLNLYNALTVDLVIDNFPVASIREIGGGLFTRGPWDDEIATVMGRALSLNNIEHNILRPIWRDARIHYGVNCASVGCPNLPMEAFTAANADRLLTAGARAYVNHPRGAHVAEGRLRVSSIYHWYEADFGGDDAGVIAHLKAYADPELAQRLAPVARVDDHGYDWSLNLA